uniref:Interleukin n=1 Tax=Oryzias melastigma TaxID=30732 RepID=A0A3B3D0E4_ORYME
MEHFIRIAFWIFVFSGCHPTISKSISPIESIFSFLKLMEKEVKCPADLKLYTPTYQKDWDTLECLQKEINGTIKEECEDPNKRIEQVLSLLRNPHPNNGTGQDSVKRTCEEWPVKSFDEFLTSFKDILHQRFSLVVKKSTNV